MDGSTTCTVEPIARTDRGSYAGQETSFGDFLVVGACASMSFLIYGAVGGLAGMGLGAIVIIAIVLVCWPIAACKVLCRRCRQCCCRCCREAKEIRPIGKVKKSLILLISVIGVGGMAALPMAGLLGDLKAGPTGYDAAECAARTYLQLALGQSGSTASFLGFSMAESEVQTLSVETTSLVSSASQAATSGSSLSTALQESVALLRLIRTSLQSQITVDGFTCSFCETCCGSQAGALVPELLSKLEGGSLNSVTALMSDFQEEAGSRISAFQTAVTGAGNSMKTVKEGIEAGPAPAVVLGKDFFRDSTVEMLTMAFEFGAVPIAGIGLLFVFYSLHWCCCLRRFKIDRKDHPAPQWAACGWCGGCLGALLGAALGLASLAVASVSQQMCIMVETLATDDGPTRFAGLGLSGTSSEAVTARSAFLACSSASATARDLFPLLGLSAPAQGLSDVETELTGVLNLDFAPILAEYQTLNDQATASQGSGSSTGAYTCESWVGGSQAASSSCDWATFQATYLTLVQQALQTGQTISTQLGVQRQSGSDWDGMKTKLQEVTSSQRLTRLQSGLNCDEVFTSWQVVQDQVCAGLADGYSTAGLGWLVAGALGFIGALGQYWIWRLLKDNRSLYLDDHDEMRVRGWKKFVCCFCATSLGDFDEDAGKSEATDAKEQSSEPATPKKAGGKTGIASKRIVNRFFQDSDASIENKVTTFLGEELFPAYDPIFNNFAVAERVASWKALEKEKQSRGDVEVQPPGEAPTDPATLLADYGDRGADGVPIADASGQKLDKKTMARLKKDLALLQKPWDKWHNDKAKYEAYLLSKIRKNCLHQFAEVEYTEDLEHLRPLSPTSRAPLVVVVQEVPEDPTKAVWSDELQQVSAEKLDVKVRKDKNVVKKFKGLEAKCFGSFDVQDPLMNKLMAFCEDPSIWEDVKIEKAAKMKAPKEPKEPKGLVEPSEVFRTGKHEGKFSDFDAKGIPTKLEDGSDVPDKQKAALTKEYDAARKKWDTHQGAVAKYNRDLAEYEKQQSGDNEGVPEKQKRGACEAAAVDILRNLINKAVVHHAKDLEVEVNKGSQDPDDLASMIVKVSLEHEDKTTDPVLKALKTVDKKKRSGQTHVDELPEVFRLLKEDELQLGSHVCFGDITQEEIDFITSCLESNGNAAIPHEELKAFIEGQDLQLTDGKPNSLAGCLVAMRLENFQSASSVEQLMSPRTWRMQLGGELPQGLDVQGVQGVHSAPKTEETNHVEEAKEEAKEKKEKKEKKDKKEEKEKKDKKEKKEKK